MGTGSYAIRIMLGNGDGTFYVSNSLEAGFQLGFGIVGDFNGDGHLDIAAVNGRYGGMDVLLGDGHGNFQAPQTSAVGAFVYPVVVGDFNGDGHLDLADGSLNIL